MTALVTGDAVVLEIRPAKLPSRALAFFIDLIVMIALCGLSAIGLFRALALDDMLAAAVGLALFVGVFVGYPVAMETLTRGRSLGKMALGLRVVRDDGGPIRFRQALSRGLAGLFVDFYGLSAFTGWIAVITSLMSPSGRRLGDMLAGTLVVRERVPRQGAATLEVPLSMTEWVESADVSRVSDALALHIRQFLRRADELDPAQRSSLARHLAAQVIVSPPPPPDTSPEALLTAVLVARRCRAESRSAAVRPAIPAPRQAPTGPAGAVRTPTGSTSPARDPRDPRDQRAEDKVELKDMAFDGFFMSF